MGKASEQRYERLLALLTQHGELDVAALARALDVSEATVRRDLGALEREGKLIRTLGGARLREESSLVVRTFREKHERMRAEKERIARAAAAYVEPGMVVALDSGTTVWRVAAALRECGELKVVTAALPAIEELGSVPSVELFCVGGRLRPENLDFVGPAAVAAFSELRADVGFLGVDSLVAGRGVFSSDLESAAITAAIGECSRRRVVVMDHSKIDERGCFLGLPSEKIDCLITDNGIEGRVREALRSEPYEVVFAE